MEIEVLLELIELILTQKDRVGAFSEAILKRKFCFPYFDYLVKEGFLPDDVALFSATKMRQIEIVRFVLEKGVKPTLESFRYAAEHEILKLCRLFVEFGSREILSTPELEKELKIACIYGDLKTAEKLINRGVDPTADMVLELTCQTSYYEIVHLLLKHGADPTSNKNIAIQWASLNSNIEVIRLLLKYGADPTVNDNYAIKQASQNGHLEIVRLLLHNDFKYKVDPTAQDNYAIKNASGRDKRMIINLLKSRKAKY